MTRCVASWSAQLSTLSISDVSRGFDIPTGRLPVLDRVRFDVGSREVIAIIGPNGCGKSTLLRAIGGLLPADSGAVLLDGRPVTGPDERVGFVFQEPRLLAWRDALSNVAFPLEIAGVPQPDRTTRAADLLALVGLSDFAAARPHQLSGGMQQRVSIARALALDPPVLLLDEPFSALDALTRERFNVQLLELWQRTGTTILVVTHSIAEALFLADRVLVLSPRPGHVVADLPVDFPRPRHPATLDTAVMTRTAALVREHLADPDGGPGSRADVRPPLERSFAA